MAIQRAILFPDSNRQIILNEEIKIRNKAFFSYFTVIEHLVQYLKMIDPFQQKYIQYDLYHQLRKIDVYLLMIMMLLENQVYLLKKKKMKNSIRIKLLKFTKNFK
jgi:hypothetical protein